MSDSASPWKDGVTYTQIRYTYSDPRVNSTGPFTDIAYRFEDGKGSFEALGDGSHRLNLNGETVIVRPTWDHFSLVRGTFRYADDGAGGRIGRLFPVEEPKTQQPAKKTRKKSNVVAFSTPS